MRRQDMQIAEQIIWEKKPEDYDENPYYKYIEKRCGPIITLDVHLFTNNKVCIQLNMSTTRDAIHILD